jgi:hypothetical protein
VAFIFLVAARAARLNRAAFIQGNTVIGVMLTFPSEFLVKFKYLYSTLFQGL